MQILRRKPLNPPNLPDTLLEAHSQAVLVQGGSCVLMSSQVEVDKTGELAGPELLEQTVVALKNIERLLSSLGRDLLRMVMLRIYLAESSRYDQQLVIEALKHRFPTAPLTALPTCIRASSGTAIPQNTLKIPASPHLPATNSISALAPSPI